jgi:protein phosphatase
MNVTLRYGTLSEKGRRPDNEDTIYPEDAFAQEVDGLFMVCDGVGGAEKGEVASRITAGSMAEFMLGKDMILDEDNILTALEYIDSRLKEYLSANPESEGMATTLALLQFHRNEASVAHVGDSRVYHFRNGEIIFRTVDHSLVNEFIQAGLITEEEARHHPQKNVITRAISGREDLPARASVSIIEDIRPGDQFLICSDGVTEVMDDKEICEVVRGHSPDAAIRAIRERCAPDSRDNYSAVVVEVMESSSEGTARHKEEENTIGNARRETRTVFRSRWFWLTVILFILAGILFFGINRSVERRQIKNIIKDESIGALSGFLDFEGNHNHQF